MTRQMFYHGEIYHKIYVRNFDSLNSFASQKWRPQWREKNFESAKTQTKYYYHRLCTARAIRIKQRYRYAFLSPWRTIEQNELSDVPAATGGRTNCDPRNYYISKTPSPLRHVDEESGTEKDELPECKMENHQCSVQIPSTAARFSNEIKWKRARVYGSSLFPQITCQLNYNREHRAISSIWHFKCARRKDGVVVRPPLRDGRLSLKVTRVSDRLQK